MAEERLDLVVTAIDKATATLAQAKAAVQGVTDATDKAKASTSVWNQEVGKIPTWFKWASAAAVAAIGTIAKQSIDAWIEADRAQQRLAAVSEQATGASNAQILALEAQAKALQKLGVVEDDTIVYGMSQLATFGLQTSSISKLTPAMADLAVKMDGVNVTQQSIAGTATLLGRAMSGNADMLGRYGIVLTDSQKELMKTGTEAERAALLVDILGDKFGGLNEATTKTAEGGLKQAENRIGDVKEEIGRGMTPVVVAAKNAWVTFLEKLTGTEDPAHAAFEATKQVGEMTAALGNVAVTTGAALGALWTIVKNGPQEGLAKMDAYLSDERSDLWIPKVGAYIDSAAKLGAANVAWLFGKNKAEVDNANKAAAAAIDQLESDISDIDGLAAAPPSAAAAAAQERLKKAQAETNAELAKYGNAADAADAALQQMVWDDMVAGDSLDKVTKAGKGAGDGLGGGDGLAGGAAAAESALKSLLTKFDDLAKKNDDLTKQISDAETKSAMAGLSAKQQAAELFVGQERKVSELRDKVSASEGTATWAETNALRDQYNRAYADLNNARTIETADPNEVADARRRAGLSDFARSMEDLQLSETQRRIDSGGEISGLQAQLKSVKTQIFNFTFNGDVSDAATLKAEIISAVQRQSALVAAGL